MSASVPNLAGHARARRVRRRPRLRARAPEPPSTALLEAETTTAATFFSTERDRGCPAQEPAAQKFLARVDALLGTSGGGRSSAPSERFPATIETIPLGDRHEPSSRRRAKRKLIVVELRSRARARVAQAVLRLLPTAARLGGRARAHGAADATGPTIPASVRDRAAYALARQSRRRARPTLAEAAIFVPAPGGSARLRLEAQAERLRDRRSGGPRRAAGARGGRRGAARRGRRGSAPAPARSARAAEACRAFDRRSPSELERRLRPDRRPAAPGRAHDAPDGDPLGDRDWIVVDLHMHTIASHDCSIDADRR